MREIQFADENEKKNQCSGTLIWFVENSLSSSNRIGDRKTINGIRHLISDFGFHGKNYQNRLCNRASIPFIKCKIFEWFSRCEDFDLIPLKSVEMLHERLQTSDQKNHKWKMFKWEKWANTKYRATRKSTESFCRFATQSTWEFFIAQCNNHNIDNPWIFYPKALQVSIACRHGFWIFSTFRTQILKRSCERITHKANKLNLRQRAPNLRSFKSFAKWKMIKSLNLMFYSFIW